MFPPVANDNDVEGFLLFLKRSGLTDEERAKDLQVTAREEGSVWFHAQVSVATKRVMFIITRCYHTVLARIHGHVSTPPCQLPPQAE